MAQPEPLSLAGRRVAFTTPQTDAAVGGGGGYGGRLHAALLRRGARPLPVPTIAIRPHDDPDLLRRFVTPGALDPFAAVAFTSRSGISAFSLALHSSPQSPGKHHPLSSSASASASAIPFTVAALGSDADLLDAEFLSRLGGGGGRVKVLVPDVATPAGLVEAMGIGSGRRVLCPVPEVVGLREPPVVPGFLAALEAAGWVAVRAPAYVTCWAGPRCAEALVSPAAAAPDAVVFTSTAEVEGLLKGLDAAGWSWPRLRARWPAMVAAVHGPVTADGARMLGVEVDVVGARSFVQTYRCYSASSMNKPQLEGGDKVIMPASALYHLASLHIDYPMLFELGHYAAAGDADDRRVSHCGVLEFVAEEGVIIMPNWMIRNMALEEGDAVVVKSASLPKGTFVKLQPHTSNFLDLANPKAMLEKTLRSFTCLTTGDTIMVSYNNKQYNIDIVETKPASAVCIVETDCEVDFAPPLNYKEPEKVPASKVTSEVKDDAVKDEPKFRAFTGSGNRLDGKASRVPQAAVITPAAAVSSVTSGTNKGVNQGTVAAAPSGASNSSRQKKGKLVFGSNASSSKEPEKAPPVRGDELPKKEEPKFQAFSGTSYSLKR
uniref:Uncharacterized protein n=1 Tax=Leersia perrieri TaxID=77586 RepID=A0A0D9XF68_9ORYZ